MTRFFYLHLFLLFFIINSTKATIFQTDTLVVEGTVIRQTIELREVSNTLKIKKLEMGTTYELSITPVVENPCHPILFMEHQNLLETNNHCLVFNAFHSEEHINITLICDENEATFYYSLRKILASSPSFPSSHSLFTGINIDDFGDTDLVEDIFITGECVDISNVTFQGNDLALGSFSNGMNVIGIESGIIMATGNIIDAEGPNTTTSMTTDFGDTWGDNDLAQTAGISDGNIFDAAVLEFDFVPTTSLVTFEYVFASEEYCDYVNSQFNDMFGFYLSGPGIDGPFSNNAINIARLPSNDAVVSINSVNHLTNSDFYVHNVPAGQAQSIPCNNPPAGNPITAILIEYDGFTVSLTATAQLQPCETYHIKLGIADAVDGLYDSAIFLGAKSFDAQTIVEIEPILPDTASNSVLEGEEDIYFRFSRREGSDVSNLLIVPLAVAAASTATEGEDFETLPNAVIIPAFEMEVLLQIVTLTDDLVEGTETLVLETSTSTCEFCPILPEQAFLEIEDGTVDCTGFSVAMNGSPSICFGQQNGFVSATVLNGVSPYQYAWSNGSAEATLEGLPQGNYIVSITDSLGCMSIGEFFIEELAPIQVIENITPTSCGENNGGIEFDIQNAMPPFQFIWSENVDTTNLNALNPGQYQYTIQDANDCEATGAFSIAESIPLEVEATSQSASCAGEPDGYIDLSVLSGTPPFNYEWSNGSTNEDLINVVGGDYEVSVTDGEGCQIIWQTTVEEPDPLEITLSSTDAEDGNNGTASVEISGGTPIYDIQWNSGETKDSITNLPPGTYEVTVTDMNGCMATGTVEVEQVTDISELEEANQWSVFPNPAKEEIWIKLENREQTEINYALFNKMGQLLETNSFWLKHGKGKIDIGAYSVGVYTLVFFEGGYSKRVVKIVKM